MEKRTLIALALSFAVIAFYPVVLEKFYPDYYKQKASLKTKTSEYPAAVTSGSAPGQRPLTSARLKTAGFAPEEDVTFRNDALDLVFNKKDGGIRQISFPLFKDSENDGPIKFLSLKNAGISPAALVILSDGDVSAVKDYQIVKTADNIRLSATAFGGKVKVEKTLSFGKDYTGQLSLRLENLSNETLSFQYELLAGSGVGARHSIDNQYIEANFFSKHDGKKDLKHINESKNGKQVVSAGPVEWVSIKDRHFSVILKPKSAAVFSGIVHGLGNNDRSAGVLSREVKLAPKGVLAEDFIFYIGPNEIEPLLKAGLDDLVNFGKFDFIGKIFVGALELLHKIFRNYGLAIIVLTILINVLLFPLTRVSYMSMKRMQLVQPQMTKLREQHKKNPEKLNKEMMELYKKHKVNPFGGCVPMLVQIPIFIALYVALSKSVILINSKFLWIKDLSTPDRVYLPFSVPFLGNYIHILPLLMCLAMFLQQKFTQIKMEGQDPAIEQQQKMMVFMMPIIFGFIFYQMPSGLVLYWLTNTILMSLYQLKLKTMTLK